MKRFYVLILALLLSATTYSQNTFKAVIKDSKTGTPLIGATALLQGSTTGATADTAGQVILTGISNGRQVLQ
ncbi:MAG: hypothetical protein EOP45_19625, partial [Sphingobacteriaceae bacterium]